MNGCRNMTLHSWDGWTRNPDGTWTAPPEPVQEDEA